MFFQYRPVLFPGQMLMKVTKSGYSLLGLLCVVIYFVTDSCLLFCV